MNTILFHLLVGTFPHHVVSFQITRPWTTQHWCKSVIHPKWPFAYSKYIDQNEETKGRVSTNAQDMRHVCRSEGVQSKCHICEDIQCGETKNDTCHFQIQGVDWKDMSKNIPTISDMPWAVGGTNRYDFGGNTTSHVCLYLTGDLNDKGACQSNFGRDYSHCPLRCWGYNTTFDKEAYGYQSVATRSSLVYDDSQYFDHTKTQNTHWPNHLISNQSREEFYVNSTPWTLSLPTTTWEYPKKAIMDTPENPKGNQKWGLLPQGATFTLAGSRNGEKGFNDGNSTSAR